MCEHDNARLARAVIEAWNARDFPAYRALLGAECVEEIESTTPTHGAAGATIQRYLNDIPDLWFDVTDATATEDTAVVSWRARGTLWSDTSPAGTARRPVEVVGFTAVGVKRGRIVRLWHSWDVDDLVRRLEPADLSLIRDAID